MVEYYTEAIVLGRRPQGELDELVTLYTKDLGKVEAFLKSSRRLLSKLSAHLLFGNLVQVRIVEKNRLQVADVLGEKSKSDPPAILNFLSFLDQVIPWGEPDQPLWRLIKEVISRSEFNEETYEKVLNTLGFGGEGAVCSRCGRNQIVYFITPDVIFLCESCRTALDASLGNRNGVFRLKKK